MKKKHKTDIEPLSLVKFDFALMPIDFHKKYPFTENDRFVYLGDILQMPGHCVVVRLKDNHVFTCYHTDEFKVLTDDEV